MTGQDERDVLLGLLTHLPAGVTEEGQEIPLLHMLPESAREYLRDAILAAGFHLTPTAVLEDAGPEAGHTFEVSVRSRGSAGVLGGPKSDANWWGDPSVVRVRAWNLPDAVAMASTIPYHKWESATTAEVKAEDVAEHIVTGTVYAHVDWSTEDTGYVYVSTGRSSYIVRADRLRRIPATHLRETGGA